MSLRPDARISYPQLLMRRPDLNRLPGPMPLPAGYVLRRYETGEDDALAEVLSLAFPDYIWNVREVRKRLTQSADVQATFVIDFAGSPIATASARFVPERFPGSGYLHWVAVHPDHQGKRLGAAATAKVLRYFQDNGSRDSVLETDDFRLPAIKTYLNLGYVPEPVDPGHSDRWNALLETLNVR